MADSNEHEEQATRPRHALQHNAERWLSLLLQAHKPSYSLARPGCVDSLVIVAVEVEIDDDTAYEIAHRVVSAAHMLDNARLRELREAIDLFYMALSLDPSLVSSLKTKNAWKDVATDPLAVKALECGGDFELHVTIKATKLDDTALLEQQLCRFFVEELDHDVYSTRRFLAARNELAHELDMTKPTWRQALEAHPVVLRYSIVTLEALHKQPYAMEDYLRFLIDFIVYAAALQPSRQNQENQSQYHLPITIDRVTFSLNHILITHRNIQVAKKLMRVRKGFAVCERVRLEPPMVLCSHDDITAFLNALASGSDSAQLVVDTGPLNTPVMDTGGMDRSELCDSVLRGVRNSDRVKSINLGGMTQFCKSPATRRGIYRAMIERLFARPRPIEVAFEVARFSQSDTQLFREEHLNWRNKHPQGRLQVKKLQMRFYDPTNTFFPALLNALDDVEILEVHNDELGCPMLPNQITATILHKFPGLLELDVSQLPVASMDVLFEPGCAKLVALRLRDFELADADSFARFAEALGDPTTQVARTLHALRFAQSGFRRNVYRMSGADAEHLAKALTTNRVLRTLDATVTSDTCKFDSVGEYLRNDVRLVVPSRWSERNSVTEQARRVAFLSVIHNQRKALEPLAMLDASVVRQIFAFDEPAVKRKIQIGFSYGDDGDYDDSEIDEDDSEEDTEEGDEDDDDDDDDSEEDGQARGQIHYRTL